jgi:thiol-disulfide isomerase/thioredoxin
MKQNVLFLAIFLGLTGFIVFQIMSNIISESKAQELEKEANSQVIQPASGEGENENQPIAQPAPEEKFPVNGNIPFGVKAPSFSLEALDGEDYKVGGKKEKLTLIHFWASWCEICREEAPFIQEMYLKYKDQVDFYGVNVTSQDKVNDVKKFVSDEGITFQTLLDAKERAATLYQIRALPTFFLVDEEGIIRDAFNSLPPEMFEQRILMQLN